MGIVGRSDAFGYRYRPTPRMGRPGLPPAPIGFSSSTQIVNYNIKGPSTFEKIFGFTFGFLGALGSARAQGRAQMHVQAQAQGVQNNSSQQKSVDELGNLRKIYSKYEVIDNPDGTYSLTKGEGVLKKGTYEELSKMGINLNEPEVKKKEETVESGKTQGDNSKVNEDASQTPKDYDAVKSDAFKNGATITVQDEIYDAKHPTLDGHITGASTISAEKDEASGFPKTITVGGKKYAFQSVDKNDSKAIYKSLDGSGQTYKAEYKGGAVVLNQREGLAGTDQTGTADIKRK